MGEMDATDFEDRCRAMFGTSAYYIYTIDKLVQSLAKQVQFILTDAKSLDLLTLFKKDREKTETSSRQEAVYRLSAESLMQDESMIRLEYFTGERVLTMQLLGKEDHISDDSFTAEEKWSFYVDQFVQLSTNAKLIDKAREPFLKRSLPATVSREPPSRIVTRSGLELKICMNTYKIFFVEGTEDYFYRKQETQDVLKMDAFSHFATRAKAVRADKFGAWMNGPSGWRMGLTEGEQAASLSAFSSLRVVRKSPNKSPMARSI